MEAVAERRSVAARERGGRRPWARAIVVAAVALGLVLAVVGPAQAFSDVPADTWFVTAVDEMSAAGVINGYTDNTFRPYEPVTRAQFAAMLHRILQTPAGTEPFNDVAESDWFQGAVASLYQAGLVKGQTATAFAPQNGVSREQVTSFVIRALAFQWKQDGVTDLAMLPYEQAYQWLGSLRDRWMVADAHQASVGNALRLQIITGYSDGRFYPMFTVTRAQAAGMLYRAFFQDVTPLAQRPPGVEAEAAYPNQSIGSSGILVQWLERRLAEMRYQPGPVDGTYDARTKDAVIAFQKVERLQRDGVVGQQVWGKVFGATKPGPRLSGSGNWVEVDLTRQVLFLVNGGSVVKILPVSTGAEGWRTPPGSYRITRKLGYWRESSLGLLYKPSYFVGGIAIHGAYSVPVYPASHGCVRVPFWATDAIYPQLPIGMPVHVFY